MRRSPRNEGARGLCIALVLGALSCSAPAPRAPAGDGARELRGDAVGDSPGDGADAAPGDEPVDASVDRPDDGPTEPRLLSGQLLSRYRARFTGGESDHDLYETLDLTVTDPEHRWSGSVLAHAAYDIDGRASGGDPTFDLDDTYSRLAPQLFHAYIDVAARSFSVLRFGRQPMYETPLTLVFDGVRAELAPQGEHRYALGGFAGVGEHTYETSHSGDAVLGGFGAFAPWSGSELRADWMHLEDERLGVDHEDDLFGLALSQDVVRADTATRVEGRFTSIEGDGRDVRLLASHVDSGGHWSLQGSLYHLLKTQRSLAAPLDPFSDTLFELFPFSQLGLSLTRDWRHFALLTGADVRRVSDTSDEGEFNRDFQRYYVTGSLPDALPVTVALTGEVWRATDTDYDTWGAALERELDGGFDVTLGSNYALYEYDLFSAEERDHVRSTFVALRWKADAARRWALRYEYEQSDLDDFQRVQLDYTWNF